MIHSKICYTLYTADYETAVNISEILNSYYDGRIATINMVNESSFDVGEVMTVETEYFRWVIEKK